MTFRPSDDILEKMADDQNSQAGTFQDYTYNKSYDAYNNTTDSGIGQQSFGNGRTDNYGNVGNEGTIPVIDLPIEEVKAPDLSDLILNSGLNGIDQLEGETNHNINDPLDSNSAVAFSNAAVTDNTIVVKNEVSSADSSVGEINFQSQNGVNKQQSSPTTTLENTGVSVVENKNNIEEKINEQVSQLTQDDIALLDESKITDIERSKIVSGIEGSINSNLDFLVDNNRLMEIKMYKKVHHLLYRWGMIFFITIIGVLLGITLEVGVNQSMGYEIVRESSIENRNDWVTNTSDKVLGKLKNDGIDLRVEIPYGLASVNGNKFQSSSNLILYKGIVVPQVISINYDNEDFISLNEFNSHEVTRQDIETLMKYLIMDKDNLNVSKNLNANAVWTGNVFQGSLIDGFNLVCLDNFKVSDIVCDKFLGSFNRFGKYYNLSYYADDLLTIVKTLKTQKKSISGICSMVTEYTQHSRNISETLNSIMEGCDAEYRLYYRKLVDFITIENSLGQPELSDEVFDDPDLNAYKLLSSQQTVYKILNGVSINENYIKSYLGFVQNLLNKDNSKNRYLSPIYKDLLYLFNNDELYPSLLEKGKLTSDIKQKIDQINNGNILYKYPSLLSQLTTPNLETKSGDFTGSEVEEQTIEDIFSKFYYMNDRLKIRKVSNMSGDNLRVQTELFTNKILSVTDGETLKLTVLLYRSGNLLYVSNIKVANQPKFSEILNIYASNGKVSFNDMLLYIDEQIGMRYQDPSELEEENPTFCEQIKEREDISIYSCDESSISLYKGEDEYTFTLIDGVLDSFKVGDEDLENLIKEKLAGTMFTRENTPTAIISIIDFTVELEGDDNIQKKLDLVDQFRIHFKMIPDDIHDIEGKSDEFLVDLTLGELKLQARYNVNNHLLTNISYVNCDKMLEIRGLTISVTTENEPQLIEIMNNPRIFFTKSNQAAYKKYQRMCDEEDKEKK